MFLHTNSNVCNSKCKSRDLLMQKGNFQHYSILLIKKNVDFATFKLPDFIDIL